MSNIAAIIALTDQIEDLIGDGNWGDAAQLDSERRRLLVEYVEAEGHGAPHLRELYERSLLSMEHIRRLRTSLSGDASRLISNSRAVDAYLGNSGLGAASGER